MRDHDDAYPLEPTRDSELEEVLGRFYDHRERFKADFELVKRASGLGRNDLCPCQSGKKVKKCHGGINGEKLEGRFRQANGNISRSPEDWLYEGDLQRFPAPWARVPKALQSLTYMAAASTWSLRRD